MSHFAVVVIGDNPEEQLAPFNENLEIECDVKIQDEDLRRMRSYYEEGELKPFTLEDLVNVCQEWTGGKDWHIVDDHIEGISYSNPDAKWDWYTIGGRWGGFLRLKKDYPQQEDSDGYCDQCRAGDIDFNGAFAEAAQTAELFFDKIEESVSGIDLSTQYSWSDFSTMKIAKGLDIEETRILYQKQEVVAAIRNSKHKDVNGYYWGETPVDYLFMGRQVYVNRCIENVMVPFAILMNGEWIEKGSMGWFGISINEQDEVSWAQAVHTIYAGLSPDTLVTCVDCHI